MKLMTIASLCVLNCRSKPDSGKG